MPQMFSSLASADTRSLMILTIIAAILKSGVLEWQIYLNQAQDFVSIWILNGIVTGVLLVSFGIQYFLLPKVNSDLMREEILELGSKYNILRRQTILKILTFVISSILIQTIPHFYIQHLIVLGFLTSRIAIFVNCFNINYQFRVLYGLELYLVMLTTTALYSILHYQIFNIPVYLIPIGLFLITYFAFEYLFMKRKHRVYSMHCVVCHFRRNRKKHILAYSLVTTLCTSVLLYGNINVLLAGLFLSMVLHMMRSFTCGNFKSTLSEDMKRSYLYIMGILLIMILSSMAPNNEGRVDLPDNTNNKTELVGQVDQKPPL